MDENISIIDMKQMECDIWNIQNKKNYVFYYDESNNCRKFWVNNSKQQFNTDYKADFVLAGVVKKGEDNIEASFETFRTLLNLQENVKEIKFKSLISKGDFLQCLKSRRLFDILTWIDKSDLYIHYMHLNNLFYTLVEIFDSITSAKEIEDFGYDYFEMKSIFYNMFKENADELQRVMVKYKYPNVKRQDIETFCKDLLMLLGNRKEMNSKEKFLDAMLKRASQSDELVFLHENTDYVMQKNYAEFYVDPVLKFQNSLHIFDQELEIQEEVKRQIELSGGRPDNYKFVDSKTNIFVQLSDVVAGILGKLFLYINSNELKKLRKDINNLSQMQVDNIALIANLRILAEEENKGFIHSIAPLNELKKIDLFFELARNKGKGYNMSI